MKQKRLLAVLLFFTLVIGTYIVSLTTKYEVSEVRAVFNVSSLKANCCIKEINEITEDYNIKVYYPECKYSKLNEKIKEKMDRYVNEFKDEIKQYQKIGDNKFALQINFDSYEYEEYISYVFHIFIDTQGAHPNTYIWTISYDTKNNEIIDIKSLISRNKDVLNVLSDYTFNYLKNDERIKENLVQEMLEDGTSPKKENFSNFAFSKKGLIIFFERYSVAPYSSGEFEVLVPYDKLDILK